MCRPERVVKVLRKRSAGCVNTLELHGVEADGDCMESLDRLPWRSSPFPSRLRAAALACTLAAAVIAGLALIGWATSTDILTRLLSGHPEMKASAAALFLLMSAALLGYGRSAPQVADAARGPGGGRAADDRRGGDDRGVSGGPDARRRPGAAPPTGRGAHRSRPPVRQRGAGVCRCRVSAADVGRAHRPLVAEQRARVGRRRVGAVRVAGIRDRSRAAHGSRCPPAHPGQLGGRRRSAVGRAAARATGARSGIEARRRRPRRIRAPAAVAGGDHACPSLSSR